MIRIICALLLAALLGTPAGAIESAFDWPMVASGRVLLELDGPLPGSPALLTGDPASTGRTDLDPLLAQIGAHLIRPVAPRHQPGWYTVSFSPEIPVEQAVAWLEESPGVIRAWPVPLYRQYALHHQPNDVLAPGQWHLAQIHGPEAWAICRGAETVQVGIIDGGVDYVHPDLADNVWINPSEDLNGNRLIELSDWDGVDNDGNGYVDDFWGWDWVDVPAGAVWPGEDPGPPDNDPSDFDGHGTHCAGDASAAADNSQGVASPGFHCQVMALRAGYLSNEPGSQGQGLIDLGCAISAVYYAMEAGAEVLSMSFGGPTPYPPFTNTLNAAHDAGLALAAAAGNDHSSQISYPAGSPHVIAVAATAPGDVLAGFSNFGSWITLCAPGEAIFSTIPNGGYGNMSGTSMATPVAAGAAALVKSLRPDWNSDQVGQWLAQTADNIDLQNPGYAGMLGGGRLNLARAVDLFVTVDSLWTANPAGGSRLDFGQDAHIFVRYHKYQGQAGNVTLTLSSPNPRVSFTQAVHAVGNLSGGQSGDNSGNPFVLQVEYGGADYEIVELEAHFTGDGFAFTQPLEVPVGRGRLLLIDADQGQTQNTCGYYQQALQELGWNCETWKRAERDALGAELSQYEAVIHFTGSAQNNLFAPSDWDDLDDYLDGGGNLIVSGQNVAQNLAATQPSVLNTMVRVEYLAPQAPIMEVNGIPGHAVTQGMHMVMTGPGGASNQTSMDVIGALPGAQPWFLYLPGAPDQLAAVRTRIGVGDLIFCAFGLESIADSTSTTTRRELLAAMLDAFGLVGVDPPPAASPPASPGLLSAYPNPFNARVRIAWRLPQAGPVTLAVYDLAGREVARHTRSWAPAGPGAWNWQPGPALGSGLYFIRLQAPGLTLQQKSLYLK
ncbi:MAG: T9SS C-terminal target domain-containing protein [Candidatus Zixiibacteriota bacterium]|nr:MAG: T9SS C-terminal target domain-containing protein [candidate division Zixibacteria bacterium]